jgi:hypothetical protein
MRISFGSVRDVRIEASSTAAIFGSDVSGAPVEVFVKLDDVPKVAMPLLCCAAVAAGNPDILIHTIIPGCHLPVMRWETSRSPLNGEPLLTISLAGGSVLTFQFPSLAAVQCGQALTREGTVTGPSPGSKAN